MIKNAEEISLLPEVGWSKSPGWPAGELEKHAPCMNQEEGGRKEQL